MRSLGICCALALSIGLGCGAEPSRAHTTATGTSGATPAASDVTAVASAATPGAPRCLPVAACSMFRKGELGRCGSVSASGEITLPEDVPVEDARIAHLEHVCEGDPGALATLHGCLDSIETRLRCIYRAPALPDYRCAFDDGVCRNVGPR